MKDIEIRRRLKPIVSRFRPDINNASLQGYHAPVFFSCVVTFARNPFLFPTVRGRFQSGEEEREPESIKKVNLSFPSGENLPVCWLDSDYRMKDR
jgi:hypothetical protein